MLRLMKNESSIKASYYPSLDYIDFTVAFAAENGEQAKKQSCTPFSPASFYVKIGFTAVVTAVGQSGLCPEPQTRQRTEKGN